MTEAIYEKLAPNECYIISKSDDGLLVVENHGDGEVVVRRVEIPIGESENKRITCPLCSSNKIRLTDVNIYSGIENGVAVRLYCSGCKKAMSLCSGLVNTTDNVDG